MFKRVLLFCFFAFSPALSFAVQPPNLPVNTQDSYIVGISTSVLDELNQSPWEIHVSTSSFVPVNVIFPDGFGSMVSFFMGCFLCFVFILGIKSA